MVKVLLSLLAVLALARAASAGPITASSNAPAPGSCVSIGELPASFFVASTRHIEFNLYKDNKAGCHASGPNAEPTYGPVAFEFNVDGSEKINFFASGFEKCGSYQADIRDVDETGAIVGFFDVLIDTGFDCEGNKTGLPFFVIGNGGDIKDYPPALRRPPGDDPPCTSCTTDPYNPTPVPEPGTFTSVAIALVVLAWFRSRV